MGEEKWIRRKPGRVSGTVVPPPAGDDPPLPQRGAGRSRHRPEGLQRGRSGAAPPPVLPDNVRPIFPPVLQSRDVRPEPNRDLNARTPRSAQRAQVRPASSGHPDSHEPAARESSAGGSATAVGTLVAAPDRPRSRSEAEGQDELPERRRPAGAGRRHAAWLATLTVLVLLTAAGTTVALLGQRSDSSTQGGRHDGKPLAGAAAAREKAARWVSREVSRSQIIGCDTLMCALLVKAGVPAADLMPMSPATQDPLGAGVIVATPDLQSQFGTRLRTEYAPAVLASFGAGTQRVDVRVIAPWGAGAYQAALNKDIAARELQGTQIVGNSRIVLPAPAKTELAAGQVDPRLLITLPALAHRHPVRVLAFYDRGPGASPGVPFTGVKLAGADPKAGLPAHAYLRWLVNFLHRQRSFFRAAGVTTAWRHGRAVVSIKFALPSPIGLLN
ncbi:MAG TPA: hypothetical protein VF506_13720 [Streptosporangiaceae bacterium]